MNKIISIDSQQYRQLKAETFKTYFSHLSWKVLELQMRGNIHSHIRRNLDAEGADFEEKISVQTQYHDTSDGGVISFICHGECGDVWINAEISIRLSTEDYVTGKKNRIALKLSSTDVLYLPLTLRQKVFEGTVLNTLTHLLWQSTVASLESQGLTPK